MYYRMLYILDHKISMIVILVLCILGSCLAEVSVLTNVEYLYNNAPRFFIRGIGFVADEHNIILDLSATGQPSILRVDRDYLITKNDEGLKLTLLKGRAWLNLIDRIPPVALVLNSVRFVSNQDRNLLPQPVIVARVIPTPTILPNDNIIYATATSQLSIFGTGFKEAKTLDLYFNPPITGEIFTYEVLTRFPLTSDYVTLKLRYGCKWRDEPGPLMIVSVDTGGGPVKVGGYDGITVAVVQADVADNTGVTIASTAATQRIYNDDLNVVITGDGINVIGNTLHFANGIIGMGMNYTVTAVNDTTISLQLSPRSLWKKNTDDLPSALILLAVNAGHGYVAVGPTDAKLGCGVAMIFEKPIIYYDHPNIYRTQTSKLHIKGAGFPVNSPDKPKLRFLSSFIEGVDFTVEVLFRTEVVLTLLPNRSWNANDDLLVITHINTRGDDAGWVKMSGVYDGIKVATVVDDEYPVPSEVIVHPSESKVYQSVLQQQILIYGTGFQNGLSFTFDPDIKVGVDYDMVVNTINNVILKLRPGRVWLSEPGIIVAKCVIVDGKKYLLGGNDGILVTTVLADPIIFPSVETVHETQTKVLTITGYGFSNIDKLKLFIRPTNPSSYTITSVSNSSIVIQLKETFAWLPWYLTLVGSDDGFKVAVQVASIDTGAGLVPFSIPVTVGYVIKDTTDVKNVSVVNTAVSQVIYNDDPTIMITGTGFNPSGVTFLFANGIIGRGVNFTVVSITSTTINLQLTPGTFWRNKLDYLPAPLTLLAMNTEGFKDINGLQGCDIAMVYEHPQVFSSITQIYRTQSYRIYLPGEGFSSLSQFKFYPALTVGVDYTIEVMNHFETNLLLAPNRGWRADAGPLFVTHINTRGDAAGWIELPDRVQVAQIVDDVANSVEIFPMGVKVYQLALQETIAITGTSFNDGISFTFDPDIKAGIDYDMEISSKNKINLKLRPGRMWRNEPGLIMVKSVNVSGNSYPLGGSSGVRVAMILADPVILPRIAYIHESETNVISIMGSGFTNIADTTITLRPTVPGAFETLSVSNDTITLQLRDGYAWLPSFLTLKYSNGGDRIPLQVLGIDTGAGRVVIDGAVTVGYVVKDTIVVVDAVTVVNTASTQVIYNDEPTIIITGTGFNPQRTILRFANGILGKGVNFTTETITETSMTLRLTPGSLWSNKVVSLSSPLTILAVNTGTSYVSVGSTTGRLGCDVATVFWRPQVYLSSITIYRTQTTKLYIKGECFSVLSKVKFYPALFENLDYTMQVMLLTKEIEITLLPNRAWRSNAGALIITQINTRGGDSGWINLSGGVQVAQVVDDANSSAGGIEISGQIPPAGVKVYQSALQGSIIITGSGFIRDMSFTFEPNITAGVDYDMAYISENKVMLKLRPNKVWRTEPGYITAMTVSNNGTTYPIAGHSGIRIAEVLANPAILSTVQYVHESETKIIEISGYGFTNAADTTLYIKPILPDAYTILSVTEHTITIQLSDNKAWLPSHLSLRSSNGKTNVPLLVLDIDTGAGQVTYDDPVTVGYVVKDVHTKSTGFILYSSAGIAALLAAILLLATMFYYYRRYMLSHDANSVLQRHLNSTFRPPKVAHSSMSRNSTSLSSTSYSSIPMYELPSPSLPDDKVYDSATTPSGSQYTQLV